jgi:membrane-bound lytic murein transglycosylase B
VPASRTAVVAAAALTLVGMPSAQTPASDAARPDFATFVEGLRSDALARGVSAATIERALGNLEPSPTVIQRDQTQAEIVLSVDRYVQRRLTRAVVRTGRQRATEHRALLRRVTTRYGVPGRVVVAIWGLESNYGRFSGVRPTVQALATLAWEGRRGAFFRGELMDALDVVDRGYIGLDDLRGSWAGAMGQTQFMPSSYLKWAEDFDGDGDRDIWKSTPDVFASIANYLEEHGWSPEITWGREVRLPPGGIEAIRERAGMRVEGCRAEREMTNALPLEQWQAFGVRTATGAALPRRKLDASLIHTGARAYLVYDNYGSLLDYNCAHSYALAVALLSDQIGGA